MKSLIWVGIIGGGLVGGWIGSLLDGGNLLGAWGIILGTVGSIAGIIAAAKLGN